jgi:hypothetical protein
MMLYFSLNLSYFLKSKQASREHEQLKTSHGSIHKTRRWHGESEEKFQFMNLKLPKTLANLFGRESHIKKDLS